MMFSAGVLAVLLVLACAGAAPGGRWVVDDDGGAGCVGVQTVGAAGRPACCWWLRLSRR